MSCQAVQIQENGTSAVLHLRTIEKPVPKATEILVKNHYAGVNFIDTYHRSGLYKVPLPFVLGREGSGIVEAIGSDVKDFKVGDRVVYVAGGAYSEYVIANESHSMVIPDSIDFQLASTVLLQGLTALSFVKFSYEVKEGDYVLIHAGAGGTGQVLAQLCRHFKAHVIATTSSEEKAEIARKAGAEHVILYTQQDVVTEVLRITNGQGVHAVFDGVGKSTFDISLAACRQNGSVISFGNASGSVPPFDILKLTAKNIRIMRPTVMGYIEKKEDFRKLANILFEMIVKDQLKISIYKVYPLANSAEAHDDLEGRRTTGKLLLKV